MKLALDATNIAPGGGLVVLGSILREWKRQSQPMELHIFISRREVGDAFCECYPDAQIIPFMASCGPAKVFWARRRTLGRTIEKLRPDAMLAVGSMVGRCGVPQYVHHQNLWSFGEKSLSEMLRLLGPKDALRCRLQRIGTVAALKKARCNTFISDYMRRLACRMMPESSPRNFTIANAPGVPLKRDNFNHSPLPVIVAVQNSDYYKDAPTLIRTLGECVRLRPEVDWRLKIAGRGNWDRIRRLAENLGVLSRVEFLGHCSSQGITELIDGALCLLFPSRCEGFGIPPLEAMSRGCAVVSSNVDALPEVVGSGGVLLVPGDVAGFADAVTGLWDDSARREKLVQAGYEQVQKFSWERSAALLAELLLKGQNV